MCSPVLQMRDSTLPDKLLPVIVRIVIIVNITILTGIPRFG
jgi:hypothetical protein